MSVKSIVDRQYRQRVNLVAQSLRKIEFPTEGWLYTVKKALGMSAAQLARRMGKSRALISNTEKAELGGGVTLKTMERMAKAMGCEFVYAIVPKHGCVEDLITAQAKRKAEAIVQNASHQMALEQQSVSQEDIAFEIERVKAEIIQEMPSDFWDE